MRELPWGLFQSSLISQTFLGLPRLSSKTAAPLCGWIGGGIEAGKMVYVLMFGDLFTINPSPTYVWVLYILANTFMRCNRMCNLLCSYLDDLRAHMFQFVLHVGLHVAPRSVL